MIPSVKYSYFFLLLAKTLNTLIMLVKQEITDNFQSLLSKTDKESFTQAKLKFYETIFANYSDEDYLHIVLTAFEKSCGDYINTDFSEKIKNTLAGDFQMILITLDAFQSEK